MNTKEINYNQISSSDFFELSCSLIVELADVSDFDENEIRPLNPKSPFHPKDAKEWDGKLIRKEPILNDLGMDKQRNIYYFYKEWKRIKPYYIIEAPE